MILGCVLSKALGHVVLRTLGQVTRGKFNIGSGFSLRVHLEFSLHACSDLMSPQAVIEVEVLLLFQTDIHEQVTGPYLVSNLLP